MSAVVTLPGGTGERSVTIDYEYDALDRLVKASYDNGTSFEYTYDAAGNVLEYAFTQNGVTTTTVYTYDAANQLLTATQGSVVWHYSYRCNGKSRGEKGGNGPEGKRGSRISPGNV